VSTLTFLDVPMKPCRLDMRVCQEDYINNDRIDGTAEFLLTKDEYDRHKDHFDQDYFLLQYADAYGASHEYQCAVEQKKVIIKPTPAVLKVEWGWNTELRAVEIDFHVVEKREGQS